jgi:hypothetical protein
MRLAREQLPLVLLATLTAAAVALGIWVRLSVLDVGSLWIDELWTLDAVSRSFKEMIGARLVSDSKPPIWSMLSWAWLRLAGTYDAGTMRLLPLGFSLAAIAVPLLGAVRLRSLRPTMLVLAALIALSISALHFAVELRSYSMMIACGTAATVVWAGLLSGDLPRRGRWIFPFTFFGALAGFAHYYGHLLYLGELGILGLLWLRLAPRRPAGILLGWGALSLLPIAFWYVLSRAWFPTEPVAPPPEWWIVQMWFAHGLGPVTHVVADHLPGYPYPSGPFGIESVVVVGAGLLIVGAMARRYLDRGSTAGMRETPPASRGTQPAGGPMQVAASAFVVVAGGVAGAWIASLILPPSMNYRNLAALLPALLLTVAGVATLGRADGPARWTGAAVVSAWLLAAAMMIGPFGVAALAPPWQAEAGYRATVRALLDSTDEDAAPALIGLKMPWDWHGQWDAAIRAELGEPPVESDAPTPLAVRWILDVQELQSTGLPASPLIVFTDAIDARSVALFAWLQEARAGCESALLGGPGYGVISVVSCPGSR